MAPHPHTRWKPITQPFLCPPFPARPQCHNLAQGLLPTIIQWFRASATPASLCASAGVCGDVLVKANVLNEVKPTCFVQQ